LKALIIRPGALGDTLMALPSLANIPEQWAVTFVGRQPGLDFIRDFVECSMDLEGPGWHRLFLERPARERLPVLRTDIAIAFFSDKDGAINRNLNEYFPHTPIHLFPSLPVAGEKIHIARYLSNCLKKAGFPVNPRTAFENAQNRPLISLKHPSCSRNTVVVHPGSGGPHKNHPHGFWLRLLKRLVRERDFQRLTPMVLLGPAEGSLYSLFKENLESIRGKICFCPDEQTLIRLLGKAGLYLGHDAGITHLAAMLGIPTIALFKENNVTQWHPLGPIVRVIQNKEPGASLIEQVIKEAKELSRAVQPCPFMLS
jgi:heptosyltransferase-3